MWPSGPSCSIRHHLSPIEIPALACKGAEGFAQLGDFVKSRFVNAQGRFTGIIAHHGKRGAKAEDAGWQYCILGGRKMEAH